MKRSRQNGSSRRKRSGVEKITHDSYKYALGSGLCRRDKITSERLPHLVVRSNYIAFDWSALITPAFITASAGGLGKLAQNLLNHKSTENFEKQTSELKGWDSAGQCRVQGCHLRWQRSPSVPPSRD